MDAATTPVLHAQRTHHKISGRAVPGELSASFVLTDAAKAASCPCCARITSPGSMSHPRDAYDEGGDRNHMVEIIDCSSQQASSGEVPCAEMWPVGFDSAYPLDIRGDNRCVLAGSEATSFYAFDHASNEEAVTAGPDVLAESIEEIPMSVTGTRAWYADHGTSHSVIVVIGRRRYSMDSGRLGPDAPFELPRADLQAFADSLAGALDTPPA